METIQRGERKARKDYYCDGHAQVDANMGWQDVVQEGGRKPVYPHKISKGEQYYYQVSKDGGTLDTWRSCQHCYQTISDFELWCDEY